MFNKTSNFLKSIFRASKGEPPDLFVKVNNVHKALFVVFKKYKSFKNVPERVSRFELMQLKESIKTKRTLLNFVIFLIVFVTIKKYKNEKDSKKIAVLEEHGFRYQEAKEMGLFRNL